MRRLWRGMALVYAVLSGTACAVGDSHEPTPVESVVVTPQTLEVVAGASAALVAEVSDAAGNVLRGRRVVWATANPGIATVSDNGVVTGVSAGRVEIAATAEGKSGMASVNVAAVAPRVATVRIVPANVDVFVAAATTLVATPYDSKGAAIPGRTTVWTTNNATVASISQNGTVTGIAPGSAVITAVIDGVTGNASVSVRVVPVSKVTVSPSSVSVDAGKTRLLTATLTDAAGNVLTNRVVTWSSSNTQIAIVNQSGVVTGVRNGTVVITATSEGKFGTASVQVK